MTFSTSPILYLSSRLYVSRRYILSMVPILTNMKSLFLPSIEPSFLSGTIKNFDSAKLEASCSKQESFYSLSVI